MFTWTNVCRLLLVALSAFAASQRGDGQCVLPPSTGMSTDESAATALWNRVVVDAQICPSVSVATGAACKQRTTELTALKSAASALAAADSYCSFAGKDANGTALTAADQSNYSAHDKFWREIVQALSVPLDGTLPISAELQTEQLHLPPLTSAKPQIPDPAPPVVIGQLLDGMKTFQIKAQKLDPATYPKVPALKVCVYKTPPGSTQDADCTKPNSTAPVAELVDDTGKPAIQVTPKNPLSATITLADPLAVGVAVYLVEIDTDSNGKIHTVTSDQSTVIASQQCNKSIDTNPFSDCDWHFSLIGGVEQSGLAAQANQTDGFLRVFTRAGYGNYFLLWGAVRLLGAPSQSSSNGVVSAFSNPTGSITTQSLTSVGYAIDYSLGFEALPWYKSRTPQYTVSLVGEFGGTTPLASTTLAAAYKAPAFGTVECQELYSRFQGDFKQDGIAPGNTTNTTGSTAACLVNTNAATSSGSPAVTTYAPVNNIGFSNQDRASFLGKWFFGARTIDRFLAKDARACGDSDPVNKVAPCARGIVDLLFGADASVNGGYFRPWVFKVDAVHPLLIKSTSYVYLFGSFSTRIKRNVDQSPLILQAGDLSSLTGTGSSAAPNVNTVVLPLTQPDRDFYRFGIGLDASCLFSKLFGSTSACSSSPTSSQ